MKPLGALISGVAARRRVLKEVEKERLASPSGTYLGKRESILDKQDGDTDGGRYLKPFHFNLAVGNYSHEGMQKRPRESEKRQSEEKTYFEAAQLDPPHQAYLYSRQRNDDFKNSAQIKGETISFNPSTDRYHIDTVGAKYMPLEHTMRSDYAWMLGLAHRKISLIMTTGLDETTLFAVNRDLQPDEQAALPQLSTLSRELLGLLRSGAYTVQREPDENGHILLVPTEKAPSLTLEELVVDESMAPTALKEELGKHGFDVSNAPDTPTERQLQNVREGMALLEKLEEGDLSQAPDLLERLDALLQKDLTKIGHTALLAEFASHLSSFGEDSDVSRQAQKVFFDHVDFVSKGTIFTAAVEQNLLPLWIENPSSTALKDVIEFHLLPIEIAAGMIKALGKVNDAQEGKKVVGMLDQLFTGLIESEHEDIEKTIYNRMIMLLSELPDLARNKAALGDGLFLPLFDLLQKCANSLPEEDAGDLREEAVTTALGRAVAPLSAEVQRRARELRSSLDN